jgi:flagellar biosynthesis protein FlhG
MDNPFKSNISPALDIVLNDGFVSAFDDHLPPIDLPLLSTATRVRQTWAVGGGKGGVGKSLVASSLAIAIAKLGYKVIAVDLDLGGANLHTTLGVHLPSQTLSDFISHRVKNLEDCVVPTCLPNLGLISGAHDSLGVTEIKTAQTVELIRNLRRLDADYVLLDLGAGTALHTVDFFNYADNGLMVFLPEPTSIENGYRFIKNAYYRYLGCSGALKPVRKWIAAAMDSNNTENIRNPADLFRIVNNFNPEMGLHLKRQIQAFQPYLIINQARTQADVEIGQSIKTVCKKYFGFDLRCLGYLEYDTSVWQSIRKKSPLLIEFAQSRIAISIDNMVRHLLQIEYDHR